jgi:hypothetical protein
MKPQLMCECGSPIVTGDGVEIERFVDEDGDTIICCSVCKSVAAALATWWHTGEGLMIQ